MSAMHHRSVLVIVGLGIPDLAPVHRILSIASYANMRLGKERYADHLARFWPEATQEQAGTPPRTVGELRATLLRHPHAARVLVYAARWFPIDEAQARALVDKACAASVDVVVHTAAGEPVLWCGAVAQLLARNDAELALHALREPESVVAPSGAFADLSDPAHILRLFASGFSLRAFNHLARGRAGYFLKSSQQREKMAAEHAFLSGVPAVLRPFFPQVGDHHATPDGGAYEIEVVPALDVGKHLINETFAAPSAVARLVESLAMYWDARPRVAAGAAEVRAQLTELFVAKTRARLEQAAGLPVRGKLDMICGWNGCGSFAEFGRALLARVEAAIAADRSTSLGFSHGDLFFSNMVFDPSTGLLKLIDPRGGAPGAPPYRADWYDLAKLSHSFCGRYDLLVYDLADLVLAPEMRLSLRHHQFPGLAALEAAFAGFLAARGFALKTVRLYEATLFVSMIPLHAESDKRVICQLCQAIDSFRAAE